MRFSTVKNSFASSRRRSRARHAHHDAAGEILVALHHVDVGRRDLRHLVHPRRDGLERGVAVVGRVVHRRAGAVVGAGSGAEQVATACAGNPSRDRRRRAPAPPRRRSPWQQSYRWNGSTIQRDASYVASSSGRPYITARGFVCACCITRERDRAQRLLPHAVVVHEALRFHREHLRRRHEPVRNLERHSPETRLRAARALAEPARTGPARARETRPRTRPCRWRSRRRRSRPRPIRRPRRRPIACWRSADRGCRAQQPRRDGSLRSLLNDAKPSTSRGSMPAFAHAATIACNASLNSESGDWPRL